MSKQPKENQIILDPCCGGRMFWFDKNNPQVLFCDIRRERNMQFAENRVLDINPDVIVDVEQLPFDDETFWHIVLDPPHIVKGGNNSWLIKKYGRCPENWPEFINKAFSECWRVLKTNGTLIFKWCEQDVTVTEIIKAIGILPLYGHKSGKAQKTHWLCFVKMSNTVTAETDKREEKDDEQKETTCVQGI